MHTADLGVSILFFLTAALYSSVGHGGASGYLAVMALAGFAPGIMKPAALIINVLVSAIGTWRFYRANCFSWRLFLPFALTSVPFAFIGGELSLPARIYRPVVGIVLLYAALQLFRGTAKQAAAAQGAPVPLFWAALLGSAIGLLSGLTGVGGGIFLSPILLLAGWADARHTAGVSAAFILVNSVAGIAGHLSTVATLPPAPSLFIWAAAAVAGGIIGSGYGSKRFSNFTLRRILAAVLVIAGLKFMLF